MSMGGVHFPLPDDVPRFDPRIQMQVLMDYRPDGTDRH